ncbi:MULTISPECIES: divergent polysaccharide deacetylase family protein [unclassified Treponema]|uniref:divergent polysaccharide deacetylase family protein n=1 Tax=unclassified Treponema TaxID=2638727 RepID=UPI0020A2C988|nr:MULTISPECIES: divergent polysaccharide deacetylase family protein [unclassified Treponema]UTC67400.1 divergent polysaccharide deacetylase family protein [Treponema sp. OMZ 789]UTC70128.1 divergent polysaccharide deacetylase family protein [Treponema sp. OMZ 790]UTC72843.1 divergent polysaccharide deacetylase family protein [Treponema sp. OMZ 791]
MAKKSTKTGKTTRQAKKSGRRRKKSKINYTAVTAGLLAVCVIMLAVFLFVIPSIKNKDEAGKTQIAEKPIPENKTPDNRVKSDKPKETEKLSAPDKPKEAEKAAAKDKPKEAEKETAKNQPKEAAKNQPKEAEKPVPVNRPKKPENPPITEKPKEQEKEEDAAAYPIQDLPELPSKGKLIFVFDDAGHNLEQLQHFLNLPFPCTIAVLPKLPNSKEAARRIRAAGKELILHQPMQALNPNIDPGPGAVKPGMSREEIKTIVASNVEEIGPIAGMNNHEGSLITSDENAMEAVLELCKEKNIYFLDSRTSSKSVVPQTAKKLNMNIWERAVFLDNKRDKAYMKKRIIDGLEIASQKGEAIMIGHVVTVDLAILLKEMYSDLTREGYTFSTISKSKN